MLDTTPAALHTAATPLLQTVGLTKRYGEFLANDAIDLDVWPAQIHALLGENGAGKSTLVKIDVRPDQPSGGELRWQGEKIVLAGPSEARELGIGMVFQHFSLFENLDRRGERRARPRRRTSSFAAISAAAGGSLARSTACRSIPSARSGGCRSASASASRSSAR